MATLDLVLLDVRMPETDGFEVCRRLKSDPHTADVPVIFMTAMDDTAHKVEGFRLGAVDYVTKPIQREELLARIQHHLQLNRLQKELFAKSQDLAAEECGAGGVRAHHRSQPQDAACSRQPLPGDPLQVQIGRLVAASSCILRSRRRTRWP